jgi:hypothetical protein
MSVDQNKTKRKKVYPVWKTICFGICDVHAYVRMDLPNPSMCSVMRCYLCCLIMSQRPPLPLLFWNNSLHRAAIDLCSSSLTHSPLLHWFLSLLSVCLSVSQSVSLGFATGRWDTNVGVGEQIQIYDCNLMNGGVVVDVCCVYSITCRKKRKVKRHILYCPNRIQHRYI